MSKLQQQLIKNGLSIGLFSIWHYFLFLFTRYSVSVMPFQLMFVQCCACHCQSLARLSALFPYLWQHWEFWSWSFWQFWWVRPLSHPGCEWWCLQSAEDDDEAKRTKRKTEREREKGKGRDSLIKPRADWQRLFKCDMLEVLIAINHHHISFNLPLSTLHFVTTHGASLTSAFEDQIFSLNHCILCSADYPKLLRCLSDTVVDYFHLI